MTTKQKHNRLAKRIRARLLGQRLFYKHDIVRIKQRTADGLLDDTLIGKIAEIIIIRRCYEYAKQHELRYGLRFKRASVFLHSHIPGAEENHGWWADADALELVTPAENRKVKIKSRGNK